MPEVVTRLMHRFLLAAFLGGCALQTDTTTFQMQTANHQWSQSEFSLLSNLSIHSLTPRVDQSNRYVNDPAAIQLGEKLFFDKRLSKNGSIACATCHVPDNYFTDGLPTARGLENTARNTPTIVGTSQQHWFFHDGRSDSLWAQALGPLENELEHGGNRGLYAHMIYSDPALRNLYETVFGAMPDISDATRFPTNAGPVKDVAANRAWQSMSLSDQQIITRIFVNLGKAIAAFETRIQPAASRFDKYVTALQQQHYAEANLILSNDEIAGLKLFIGKANCFICHNGPMFSDSEFHNVNTPPIKGREYDWGRFNGAREMVASEFNCRGPYNDATDKSCNELKYIVTDKHETIGSMKTPGLRNVSKTAPYMHAGQYQTLSEVIKHYNNPPPLRYRQSDLLDIDLNETEMKQLEAFMLTLNSSLNATPQSLTEPE